MYRKNRNYQRFQPHRLPHCRIQCMPNLPILLCFFLLENTDSSMKMRSAYSIAEFQSLLQSVPSLLNKLGADASNALFVYLMKLRLGDSNEAIAQYFETNRWKIAETLNIVRKSLLTDIVPKYVNHARSRVDLLSHCSELSRKLFLQGDEDRMVAIWDATYIYVEKSLNHQFQKQTYNSHKKRNYVKPMVCVASDGTIICTVGPFKATENDASIMTKIIPKNIPAMRNFIENDVMLVDRGFRDCVEDFEERGFEVRIPAHAGGMQQLSTIEANRTRFVTKCRFEIERINGVMKNKFKIFSKVQETYWIPNIMDDFTIAAALNNHLNSIRPARTTSSADNDETARKMLERLSQPNLLHDALKGIKFAAVIRAKKYHVFENQLTFPNLQYADLKSISLGVYQINQSKLYAYDHIRLNNNQFILYTFPEECSTFWEDFKTQNRKPVLLMINIKSRFVSARKYRAFVLYDANKQGADTILGYYCSCKNGLRTVGCCSHTMTIIYYLGFAQYNGGVREPSKHLREVFNRTNHDENEPDTDTEECDDHGENDAEEYLSMI